MAFEVPRAAAAEELIHDVAVYLLPDAIPAANGDVQVVTDVLVNHHDVLDASETAGSLVTGVDNPGRYKVAVVATGPAGIVAAYELLRVGVEMDIVQLLELLEPARPSCRHRCYATGSRWTRCGIVRMHDPLRCMSK